MLGKLLRYEMFAVGRIMVPMYIGLLVMAFMAALGLVSEFGMGFFMSLIFVLLGVGVLVATLVLVFQRFYNGIYGEQGYLTWSIPASVGTQLWNKILSGMIWFACSELVLVISVYLVFLIVTISGVEIEGIVGLLSFRWLMDSSIRYDFLMVVLFLIASAVKLSIQFYAAISVGHLAGENQNVFTGLAFVGSMAVEGFVGNYLPVNVDKAIDAYEAENSALAAIHEILGSLLTGSTIMNLIFAVIYFLIVWWILKYKLNLR